MSITFRSSKPFTASTAATLFQSIFEEKKKDLIPAGRWSMVSAWWPSGGGRRIHTGIVTGRWMTKKKKKRKEGSTVSSSGLNSLRVTCSFLFFCVCLVSALFTPFLTVDLSASLFFGFFFQGPMLVPFFLPSDSMEAKKKLEKTMW